MKFVWKDDALTASTENRYTVKNDNNEIVYEGHFPIFDGSSYFYLNRLAQKLMGKGTVDFTTGVTSHPEMSIGLTVYNENEQALKNEVYVNAFNGEPTNYLSNPINGKLDPRMMFLWTLYGQRSSIIAINEPQPPQPEFILQLSGATAFTYEQQSSEITVVQCTDWEGVSVSKSGSWFDIVKTRTGVVLNIDENDTESARTGSISFYYDGDVYTSITITQNVANPFVLELSGNTTFNHRYQSSVLYVTDCTDWNSVSVECDADWIIATKVSFGVYLVIQENSGVARISPLRFYSNGRLVKTVDILQIADFSITLSGERTFYYPQQQSNIYVVQCTDWDPVVVQTDADWFTMEKTSTGVTLYIQENTTESSRTAQINFYYFSLLVDTFTIHQLHSSGWENEYFTTVALSDGYIGVKRIPDYNISRKLAYRKNYGEWVEGKISGSTYTTFGTDVSSGDVVEWKAVPDTTAITGNNMFGLRYYTSGDTPYKVCGNLLSLAFGSNYKEMDYPMDFTALFFESKGLVDAVNLALPSNVVGHCYRYMFRGCTSLTAVPYILPATELAGYCYYYMFSGCTSLVNAPVLPATVLASECYQGMFKGCTSLINAPTLQANLDYYYNHCYDSMFEGCTSLTTAPALPATTLGQSCYSNMFKGCTSLTTAPVLPATTLAPYCYQGMFRGCTSLTTAPELPSTAVTSGCYEHMFAGCTSLATAPILSSITIAERCYRGMFEGCTSITTAPELPLTTLAQSCYAEMFAFCTSLVNAPVLPATTLAWDCYASMFEGCTSITTAPELPATAVTSGCYQNMFYGCTSLQTAPELPAATLEDGCYYQMFFDCTSLNYVKCLAETFSGDPVRGWLSNVSSAGTFVKKQGVYWTTGFSGIPDGWTIQEV